MREFIMGIVIDMAAYRICQDIVLSIIHRYTQAENEGYSTNHLYLMALQARKIIYYPEKNGVWKTSCAFNVTQALKTGIYTLKRPEHGLIRLAIHEKPLFYVDMYFRKSFYSSEKIHAMLDSLVDGTAARIFHPYPAGSLTGIKSI